MTIELGIDGTAQRSSNCLDLKNPYFRYSGLAPAQPPAASGVSPTETYFGQTNAAVTNSGAAGPRGESAAPRVVGYNGTMGLQDSQLVSNMVPVYGGTALATGSNGSVMSSRVSSNVAAGGAYVVPQEQVLPANTVHPSLASRFGIPNLVPQSSLPMASNQTVMAGGYVQQPQQQQCGAGGQPSAYGGSPAQWQQQTQPPR